MDLSISEFSSLLKTNFEDRNLWLRFGLTLTLSRDSPQSALQAFNECLRIDQYDPLPAMLAAKLLLEDLDDLEDGLKLVGIAIERCQRLVSPSLIPNGNQDVENNNTAAPNSYYLEARCCYKNISPLLSKCYLLASVMHAHIYEREPESIKHLKRSNLKASLNYLDLATKTYSDDYLVHFHRALHETRQKSYSSAIDNLRRAIKLNPHHVPSMQLLILSLSGLKLYDEALLLCKAYLYEFEDNLLLLYIKCNLEQHLADTLGYKAAFDTAQRMMRCVKKSKPSTKETGDQLTEIRQTTNLFAEEKGSGQRFDSFSDELSVWLFVAEIFMKIGSISDAELCIDEGSIYANGAISYRIMFTRGLIAKAKNNLNEAKSFFQSCLALEPRHARALQQIAHVHYQLGNYLTAEKFLKDSLDIDSDSHESWHFLSLVFIETQQHEKANECVKKANLLKESLPIISISAISRLTLE